MQHGAIESLRRRVGWLVFAGLAWWMASGGSAPAVYAEETLTEAIGTIQKVGDFGYGIVPDADPGTRYAPTDEVPEAFRQDGLRVVFSGTLQSADEGHGGRRWGTPIVLTRLEVLPDASDADEEDAGVDSDEPSRRSEG